MNIFSNSSTLYKFVNIFRVCEYIFFIFRVRDLFSNSWSFFENQWTFSKFTNFISNSANLFQIHGHFPKSMSFGQTHDLYFSKYVNFFPNLLQILNCFLKSKTFFKIWDIFYVANIFVDHNCFLNSWTCEVLNFLNKTEN